MTRTAKRKTPRRAARGTPRRWRDRLLSGPSLALAALVLITSGCEESLTEVNEDPNAPEVVPAQNVLLGGTWDVVANSGNRGAFGKWTQLYHGENWVQHIAQPVYNDEDKYTPRSGVPSNIWDEMYSALRDLHYARETATTEGNTNLAAAAEIMTIYGFMVLTDYFGAIPYEEALSLEEDVAFPSYTPQSEIYPDLIDRLAAVAGSIDVGAAPEDFADFDPVYQGDMQGWLEFANSLRLRLSMRMAETELSGDAMAAFQEAWGSEIFTSVDGHADVEWEATQPAANPVYEGIVLAGRTGDFRMSASLVDSTLIPLNDPRLPIYADSAESDGEYRGLRNGLVPADYAFDGAAGTSSDFSTIGAAFLQPTAPSVLMSYAEVLFLGAEAAERGWTAESAADLYTQGIEASMVEHGVEQAEIDAYLAQPEVAFGAIEDIWLQKWIALYLAGPEAFSEMRRVGWLDLEPAANSSIGDNFPARLYYPPEEALYNSENYPGDVPITEPVWWMGG